MRRLGLLLLAAALAACGGGDSSSAGAAAYRFDLPADFPQPRIPADNPITQAKVELGQHLFYDQRMAVNQAGSCVSCHLPERAFTDGRARSVGPTGEVHSRNAMSLTNAVYNARQNWANPVLEDLRQQALAVMFNTDVVELGWSDHEDEILARFEMDPLYQELFATAYPDAVEPFSANHVAMALASFTATLISGDSAWDRATRSENPDQDAVSPAARRGADLFFSERLECFHCHGAFNFAQSVEHDGSLIETIEFKNTGLYNIAGPGPGLPLAQGNYPPDNQGLYAFTQNPADMGKFRAPTLRNIALTAPYMHDGSIQTLEAVITDHYARGGRRISEGARAGDGADNPHKDALIQGFEISAAELADLLAFFEALTDWTFICNPEHADPFGRVPSHENCP